MKVLAIDPSGNFNEGKGVTGWALMDTKHNIIACGQIRAKEFNTRNDYWNSVINLITQLNPKYLVVEDFLLYASKASAQINSRFETVKLIGVIEYLFTNKLDIHLQRAVDVKNRWKDSILVANEYISQVNNRYYSSGVLTSDHMRDAIRHAVHFITFKLKERKPL